MRRGLIILLTILLIGGHTAGLQLVAWGGMFAARVQTAGSVAEAFITTIDGSKPCRICHVVMELEQDGGQPTGAPDAALKTMKKPPLSEPALVALPLVAAGAGAIAAPVPTALRPRLPPDVDVPPPRT